MNSTVITSHQAREGKTTLAVNILSGCLEKGRRAWLLDRGRGQDASSWLKAMGLQTAVLTEPDEVPSGLPSLEDPASSLLVVDLERQDSKAPALIKNASFLVLTVHSRSEHTDFDSLADWDRQVAAERGRGFDLVVPNLYDPREWQQNEIFLDRLAIALGWERIANPVPH